MHISPSGTVPLGAILTSVALTAALMLLVPDQAVAKRGGSDDHRSRFYGLVQERPEQGMEGRWVIGGRTFIADSRTEFDQADGPLKVGSCAKVDLRSGRVHEIDSEPPEDCR